MPSCDAPPNLYVSGSLATSSASLYSPHLDNEPSTPDTSMQIVEVEDDANEADKLRTSFDAVNATPSSLPIANASVTPTNTPANTSIDPSLDLSDASRLFSPGPAFVDNLDDDLDDEHMLVPLCPSFHVGTLRIEESRSSP